MKKFLSLLVALVLCLSTVAFAAPMITEPAWDVEPMDAEVVVYMRSNQGVHEDIWWWDFCREYFKINFKVTQTASASDYKSIAFMGGEMPDVFYQLFISSAQQVEMGDFNGFLMDLTPYINAETMPNLNKILEANPGYLDLLKTQEGAVYCLGSFNNANDSNMKFFINQKWLQDAGLEIPKTLDEFEVVLEAFKNRGEGVVPIGGDLGNGPRLLANAMGWTTHAANFLTTIALRDGKPEFMYGNKELFPVFMNKMKEWIDKGYFSANIFASQVSGDEENALKATDKVGVVQSTANLMTPTDWTSMYFLTSEYNETSQIGRTPNAMNNQSFSLASDVKPELADRLIAWGDWHYDYDNYQVSHMGPSSEDTEWLLGLESGWTAVKDETTGKYTYEIAEVLNGKYGSTGEYQNQRVQGIIGGYFGLGYDMFKDATYPYNPTEYKFAEDEHILPYIVETYPDLRFFSMDDTLRASELSTAINTWVNETYAKFISGDLEINDKNLEDFYAKLEALGHEEHLAIYVDYYNNLMAAE